jgi:hypothetical protein
VLTVLFYLLKDRSHGFRKLLHNLRGNTTMYSIPIWSPLRDGCQMNATGPMTIPR